MAQSHLLDEGISWELAQHRKSSISNLRYNLSFSIPENNERAIEAIDTLSFDLSEPMDVIIDFNESADKVHRVGCMNGGSGKVRQCNWEFVNGHIVVPKKYTREGRNVIVIEFTAGNQGLNRREGYVYTLFVPDRAHTVFPCFDQPNMKAIFTLNLEVPEGWCIAQNGNMNTPIPTYLFAFAAGEFQYEKYEEDGVKIGAYYRENDSARIAQLPEIMHQVVFAMKWQEDFTGVQYPFPKYDLVILT